MDVYVPFDVENRSPPPFDSLYFYFNRDCVKIEQSCNGLLLCSAFHNCDLEYYVFNPTTKQLAFIPPVPGGHIYRFMALAFHRTHCVHYKVVCVRALEPRENMFQIRVYSSDTGRWKVCVESFSAPRPIFSDPVYWNGAFYWLPYDSDRDDVYFKLDVEQLQTLPVPEGLVDDDELMQFGESRGHLHLISSPEDEKKSLIVYEMLMDRSGWFVKYRVQLDELKCAFPEMYNQYCHNFEVVDVVRGKEEEEDTFLVLIIDGTMMIRYRHRKSVSSYKCTYGLDIKAQNFEVEYGSK
ncbi:F-box protein At5g07610-like [Bidens hawaiensis]|uniref:F-box protein At5g07610-like n=1 Tax=Bidens hawaiensis TaxID=980011 RepID=UPI0040491908